MRLEHGPGLPEMRLRHLCLEMQVDAEVQQVSMSMLNVSFVPTSFVPLLSTVWGGNTVKDKDAVWTGGTTVKVTAADPMRTSPADGHWGPKLGDSS